MSSKNLYLYDEHDYKAFISTENSRKYYRTGYEKLDKKAMPRSGEITMIPAFTDHGKSSFLRNIAYNMYKIYPAIHILYYAFEGTCGDTYTALARLAHYHEIGDAESKCMHQKQYWEEIVKNTPVGSIAINKQKEISDRIHVIDKRCKPSEIQSHIADAINNLPSVSIVMIDYLQDLKSESHYEKGHSEIEQVLENIEDFTTENSIATIIAAQYGSPGVRDPDGKKDFVGLTKVFGSSSAYKKCQLFLSLWNETAFQRAFKDGESNPSVQKIEVDILKQKGQYYGKNLCFDLHSMSNRILESADHYEVKK